MSEDQKQPTEKEEKIISLWTRLYPEERLQVLTRMLGPKFLITIAEDGLYNSYLGPETNYTEGAAMLKAMADAFDTSFNGY